MAGLGIRVQAESQPLLLVFTWHLGRTGPKAGEQQRMKAEPVPRVVLHITEEPWDASDTAVLSKELESLGLQSCLG